MSRNAVKRGEMSKSAVKRGENYQNNHCLAMRLFRLVDLVLHLDIITLSITVKVVSLTSLHSLHSIGLSLWHRSIVIKRYVINTDCVELFHTIKPSPDFNSHQTRTTNQNIGFTRLEHSVKVLEHSSKIQGDSRTFKVEN